METKESIVKKVTFKREWKGTGDKGAFKMYAFDIEFDNGDKGVYNSRQENQNTFVQGKIATYTIETIERNGPKGPWTQVVVKPYKQEVLASDKVKNKRILKAVALETAILLKAHIQSNKKVIELADVFYEWVEETVGEATDTRISAQAALLRAATQVSLSSQKIKDDCADISVFLKYAKSFYDYMIS